jgi:transcriptional regulator with XRE-family HTH domain
VTFPSQILQARTKLGLTQVELGAVLGVSSQTVSNWECGATVPWPKQQVDILGRLLQITIDGRNAPELPSTSILDRLLI